MRYFDAKRFAIACALTALSSIAQAGEQAPRIVQEPVLGLRYEVAKTAFDPLPADVLARCTTTTGENGPDRLWIFAVANDAARAYYVVGGYGERMHPAPPNFPKYTPYDYGDLLMVEGVRCTRLGSVRELFDDGPFDDLPQPILRQLAVDLALRLARGFGGAERLRAELRNQRIDFDRLPPELRAAFVTYATP